MGTTVVPVNANLPASIRALAAQLGGALITEISGGVLEGFPVIKYKGKVWAVQHKGETQLALDANGHAVPAIEVVLARANPSLSKIYYEAAYEEGSNAAPDCFSNLGDVPDPSVQNPQARACAVCPKNVWGSKITPQGKKTKACQDSRRMAVVFADQLAAEGENAPVLLLRVPPASLAPVKEYGEKVLGARGIPYFAVVTMISFDPQAAHPQFVLKPKRGLNEFEANAIVTLREDPVTLRILAEAPDYDPASPTGAGELAEDNSAAEQAAQAQQAARQAAQQAAQQQAAAAQAKPAAKAKPVTRPATDEEAGADLLAGLTQPTTAQTAQAAGKSAAAKANGKAPAKPAAKPAAAPVQPSGDQPEDPEMSALLDSILG